MSVAGWGRWTSDEAPTVFPNGQFVFPATHKYQSDFFRFGGQRFAPDFPSFIPLASSTPSTEVSVPNPALSSLLRFASIFPLPQGGDEVAMHAWSRRAAEQAKFDLNDGWEYGLKSTSATSPVSNNIARRRGSEIETWDYIEGSAGPTPRIKSDGGEYFSIPMQTFHPVTAVNHLAAVGPTPGRAVLAQRFIGTTAFDLAARVAAGDFTYYNQVIKPRKLSPVVQAYIKTIAVPGRVPRTMDAGLVQLEKLFALLERDSLQCMVMVHVGTGNDGTTWEQALDYGRRLNALCRTYPKAIAVIVGGLELTQSFEADYMRDPQFHRDLEACFDLQFPYAPGAGHGGEPVNLWCGSVAVHHEDRSLDPDTTGRQMRDAQVAGKRQVIGKEPRRIEANGAGQATGDLNYVRGSLQAMKAYALGGSVVHVAAGRGCNVNELDPVQNAALDLYAAEVAVTVPPPTGDPILDAPLTPAYPTGYNFWVTQMDAIEARVATEYQARTGRVPARSDIAHNLWRAFNEGERWRTLRGAMEEVR